MSFMNGTMVNMPGGSKPIEDIQQGDTVRVASLGGADVDPEWTESLVQMSAGTGDMNPTNRTSMICVVFGDSSIVCSCNQLFLMPGGRLKRADKLVPGDRLIEADGTHVTIGALTMGEEQHGEHAIAVAGDYAGTPNGHLIEVAGIVCGDYLLQIQANPSWIDDSGPQIGTREYDDRHPPIGTRDQPGTEGDFE